MELFEELLFTVGLSVLVSFVITKLFSMSCYSDATGDNSLSVSVVGVIEEAVFCEQRRDEKPVVWDSKGERRACFVHEAVEFNEPEEESSRAETVGSPLTYGDDGVHDCEEVSEEVRGVGLENKVLKGNVFIEEAKVGLLNEERETVGGVEFEVNLVDESSEREKFHEIGIESEDLVGKSPERVRFRQIEIKSAKDEVGVSTSEEVWVSESEDNKGDESEAVQSNENDCEEAGLFDDWEGIERTELEKCFGAAVVFAGSKSNADRISSIDSDTKMQLYGLHKVAIEGPCHVPQPMALKVSARAKWNTWQQLGDMNREVAMEQYITVLSRNIPGWMGGYTEDGKQSSSDAGISTNIPSNLHKQPGTENESEERKRYDEGSGSGMIGIEDSNTINTGKE